MRWYNVSYADAKIRREVEAICGKPHGLWTSVRLGGTGTARMRLVQGSGDLMVPFDREEDRGYLSIEVRMGGLLLRCRSRLETMALPLSWASIQGVALAAPDASGQGQLTIDAEDGQRLVMLVPRDHWGAVCRLLRRSVPEGRFRTLATLLAPVKR